jgi:hypothetical protein
MKYLLLLSVLLLGATWAAAQNYPSQTSPSQTSPSQTTPAGTGGETTVQGCLSGSSGNYMLTDKKGNSFQLTGDTAKLSEHVGHEIKVTGTTSSASASPSGGTDSSKAGEASDSSQQAIEVSSVKHISKTCQNGGTSH